ncbi:MAG: hypothetical protein HRT68_07170 [Flavobacteriaceae bacterium]|nr:hypothetical protein [Flavobacteriaceae bacterium]
MFVRLKKRLFQFVVCLPTINQKKQSISFVFQKKTIQVFSAVQHLNVQMRKAADISVLVFVMSYLNGDPE